VRALLQPGDYVKVEFVNDRTHESEWMWIEVPSTDASRHVVFERLDSEPIVKSAARIGTRRKLRQSSRAPYGGGVQASLNISVLSLTACLFRDPASRRLGCNTVGAC